MHKIYCRDAFCRRRWLHYGGAAHTYNENEENAFGYNHHQFVYDSTG